MIEKAFRKAAIKKTWVYGRRERFRDGRVSVNDDPRCGRPSTSTNDENMEHERNIAQLEAFTVFFTKI
jgi:hypothetical protein